MIKAEAKTRYKFRVCAAFLEKLKKDGVITEKQRKRIETAVLKKLTAQL